MSQVFQGPTNITTRTETKPEAPKAKKPSRAQLLASALKQCRKRDAHKRKRRLACERAARKRYGPVHKAKVKSKHVKQGRGR